MGAVLVVCGATASGKTAFAVRMAQRLKSEVVSADCMLVYKGLNIGTAKPSEEERGGIVHHLMDVADPSESFSVSDYERLALPVCERLLGQGKVPVVCGGRGFIYRRCSLPEGRAASGRTPSCAKNMNGWRGSRERKLCMICSPPSMPTVRKSCTRNDVRRVVRALESMNLRAERSRSRMTGSFRVFRTLPCV